MENINEILDSEEFKTLFDIESENEEIEKLGWKMSELLKLGEEISENK